VVTSATTGGRKLTQDHDYRNNTGAWLIGLPTRTLSTGCTSAGVCTTRESTFDYDDKGNPTVTVAEPNRPTLKLTPPDRPARPGLPCSAPGSTPAYR